MKGRRRKSGHFDADGRKIPSQHSPIREGGRVAGPRGGSPRWAASLARSWRAVDEADAAARADSIARDAISRGADLNHAQRVWVGEYRRQWSAAVPLKAAA
jgi:hypothetical protein